MSWLDRLSDIRRKRTACIGELGHLNDDDDDDVENSSIDMLNFEHTYNA